MRRIAACLTLLFLTAAAAAGEPVRSRPVAVPWRPGAAQLFLAGTAEEGGRRAETGELAVTVFRPEGEGPFPFMLLLHGCGGLGERAMWTKWVEPWTALLNAAGVGAAVVDSFAPRGVAAVCRADVAAWALRRADDAHSARVWLAAQPYVDASRIGALGMSNGGRTVLAALRTDGAHEARFRAGVALYPGCGDDGASRFDAPLLILIGRGDRVTPAAACERMAAAQPAGADLRLAVYPNAPHTFDMALPDRTHLGMRLGSDAAATADARRRVIGFLAEHGIGGR